MSFFRRRYVEEANLVTIRGLDPVDAVAALWRAQYPKYRVSAHTVDDHLLCQDILEYRERCERLIREYPHSQQTLSELISALELPVSIRGKRSDALEVSEYNSRHSPNYAQFVIDWYRENRDSQTEQLAVCRLSQLDRESRAHLIGTAETLRKPRMLRSLFTAHFALGIFALASGDALVAVTELELAWDALYGITFCGSFACGGVALFGLLAPRT